MAYLQPFLRLVAIGEFFGTPETFSFSMSLISAVGPTPATPDEVPEEIVDAYEALWSTLGLIGNGARLTSLKLNLIGTNGRYVNDETVEYLWPTPYASSTTGQYPPQVALAITLRTASARGLAHAGRFYLPSPGTPVGSLGFLSDAQQTSYAVAAKQLLDDVNESLGLWQVGVVSDRSG